MSDRVGRVAVLVVAVTCLLAVTGVASAATSDPRYDENGRIIETPFVPAEENPQLHEKVAIELALSLPRVEEWVARYPEDGLTKTATYDAETKEWKVKVWSDRKDAGQIVLATVDDDAGAGHRSVDRPAGRLDDGARLRGLVRPEDQRALDLVAARGDLLRRPRQPSPPALDAKPRSASCSSPSPPPGGSSTRDRSSRRCRSPTRPSSISSAA